jgi:hypothetical protein
LTGQYATKAFAPQPYIPVGPSFMPDVAIPIRSTDFFARFDPVLAAIVGRSAGCSPGEWSSRENRERGSVTDQLCVAGFGKPGDGGDLGAR